MSSVVKRRGALWIVLKTVAAYTVGPALTRGASIYETLVEYNKPIAAAVMAGLGAWAVTLWWPHRAEPSVEWSHGYVAVPSQMTPLVRPNSSLAALRTKPGYGIIVRPAWTATVERPTGGCGGLPTQLRRPSTADSVPASFIEVGGKCVATLPYDGPDASSPFQQVKHLAYELLLQNPWALLKANVVGATWQAATFMAVAVPLVALSPLLLIYGALFSALAIVRGLRVVAGWPFAPRAADEIADPPPADANLVLCQLSDLHCTAEGQQPFEIEAGESIPPAGLTLDSAELSRRTAALLMAAADLGPPLLVVTGDVTDGGTDAEWAEFDRTATATGLTQPLLVLPGNHDLCINADEPDLDLELLPQRKRRFLNQLRTLERGAWSPSLEGATELTDAFPRQTTLASGVRIIGLDSNGYASRNALSNAVGVIGDRQLTALKAELARGSGPVIVLTHHHVSRPFDSGIKDPFLIALDAKLLLRLLCQYNKLDRERNSVLVLHGHRHVSKFSTYTKSGGSVSIYGHPSSTMGNAKGKLIDGVPRFTSVWLDSQRRWFVKIHPLQGGAA